jgi:hypothetical protein
MVSGEKNEGDMGFNQFYFLGAIGIDVWIEKGFFKG